MSKLDQGQLEKYLVRVGLAPDDVTLSSVQTAHVRAIPYENIDVLLDRTIELGLGHLFNKLVEQKRGGYCFEQNTLFAAVLEALGFEVTRCLGRVRLGDSVSPRPATHMALLVDGQLVDVGFGSANPIGPVPLGGEATYSTSTWSTERVTSPEGESVWLVKLFDMPLYTFDERDHHVVDYLAPNHYSSTHPASMFRQNLIVQRWDEEDVQVGIVNLELLERGRAPAVSLDPAELGAVLEARFGMGLDPDEMGRLRAFVASSRDG